MLRCRNLMFRSLVAGAFSFFMASFSSTAYAVLTLSLDDGGGPTVITDLDGDGKVTFDGALSTFTTNVSTGLSKPILVGGPTLIDLNSVNVSNSAGKLVIELSDSGFTNATSYLLSAVGGTTNGSVTYETFYDPNNGNPFDAVQLASKTINDPFFSAGNQISVNLDGSSPYSLGLRVTVEHGPGFGQVSSFNSEIKVPEPGSLGLLGTGLILAAFAFQRQRRRP